MSKSNNPEMRVLLFHFAEFGGLGGVEVAVLTLAEALKQRGFVPAIAEIAPKRKSCRTLPSGIPVWTVAASSYPTPWRPRSWASFVRSTLQFQQVLKDFYPNVVHVHYPVAQCFPVVGASVLPHGWKLVVTIHNSDIRVSPFEVPALKVWQPRLFKRANALTAVSQALLDDAVELYGPSIRNASVIHNGVGPQWFEGPLEPYSNTNYILFVGRLHAVKGVDLLLNSWKEVACRFPKTELWLAGDGPERQNLESLAGSLGVSKTVRFLGAKTLQELPALYRNARAVVLPSRREGLPISLLEAGACGAICIGTRIPGIPEIIQDGVTGYIVPPESPQELAKAMTKTLGLAPEQVAKMRQATRDYIAAEFSMQRMIDSYVAVYESVLQ